MQVKQDYRILFLNRACVVVIVTVFLSFFYSCKDTSKENQTPREVMQVKKEIISPYITLLDKIPVYKDSTYSIYITSINKKRGIFYLREGVLTKVQRGSKFFLHIYPVDKNLLKDTKSSSLPFDFDNKIVKFKHNDKEYYVSGTKLPNIHIDKINTGQYNFKEDKSINWRINTILSAKTIQPILTQNGDTILLKP